MISNIVKSTVLSKSTQTRIYFNKKSSKKVIPILRAGLIILRRAKSRKDR